MLTGSESVDVLEMVHSSSSDFGLVACARLGPLLATNTVPPLSVQCALAPCMCSNGCAPCLGDTMYTIGETMNAKRYLLRGCRSPCKTMQAKNTHCYALSTDVGSTQPRRVAAHLGQGRRQREGGVPVPVGDGRVGGRGVPAAQQRRLGDAQQQRRAVVAGCDGAVRLVHVQAHPAALACACINIMNLFSKTLSMFQFTRQINEWRHASHRWAVLHACEFDSHRHDMIAQGGLAA